MFQTAWAEVDGKREDILKNGEKSCAAHVSGILVWFELTKWRHATVSGTVKDMLSSGWYKVSEPKVGAVLHWEKLLGNGEENEHLGFCMGDKTAVSNSRTTRTPIEHHITYGETNGVPKRNIVAIYWHPSLNK